ncbi:dihydroorotase [Spirochaetia bacterium]|nr:dihydroorotase [Spirochaetia bacterium]
MMNRPDNNNSNATIIRGGLIADGSGGALYAGDILIRGSLIEAVETPGRLDAAIHTPGAANAAVNAEVIDTGGKIVCPGFIDMHRHHDIAVFNEGFGDIEIKQGITSCFAGNCGMAPVPNVPAFKAQLQNYLSPCLGPFDSINATYSFSTHREYLEQLQKIPLPLNMGFYAGMGAIKIAVKGFSAAPFSADEMKAAQKYLEEAMDCGAAGLSIGLMYIPEAFGNAKEIAALARVMKGRGILCTHMRWETENLVRAVKEVIDVAKEAEVPLEISHFKAAGTKAWHGVLREAIDLIENERADGMDITVDFYPYDCGSSTMMQMLPPGYLSMGVEEAIAGLNNPVNVEKMRRLLIEGEEGWDNLSQTIGWDRTIISSVSLEENKKYLGKNVGACTQEFGFRDEAEFIAQLMYGEQGKVAIINQSMSQEDIDTIARLPYSSLISDALYGDMKRPHPRLTGAFPCFLRDFVRDRKILKLEEAIHKMTSRPAQRLGLSDRGLLKPGYRADVLVFDPASFRDKATYLSPTEQAVGLDHVLIGGQQVLIDGKIIRRDAGQVIR